MLLRFLLPLSSLTQREEGYIDQKIKCSGDDRWEFNEHNYNQREDRYDRNIDSAYANKSTDRPVGEDLEGEPDETGEGRMEGSSRNEGSK